MELLGRLRILRNVLGGQVEGRGVRPPSVRPPAYGLDGDKALVAGAIGADVKASVGPWQD